MRPDTKGSIDRYVSDGLPPGGFVTAVLTNDLFGAINRADNGNLADLVDICKYVYNHIPMECWGNEEKMLQWMQRKHHEREVMRSAYLDGSEK